MSTDETVQVSSTGGQKAGNDERYDLIPVEPLRKLARHYGIGAKKYSDDNWRKGYDWRLSYAALQRHINQFWAGEDIDEETGSPHMVAAAWHCLTLLEYAEIHPEFDTRLKTLDQRAVRPTEAERAMEWVLSRPNPFRPSAGGANDQGPNIQASRPADAGWQFTHGEGSGSFTGQKRVEPKWCDTCEVWYHPDESKKHPVEDGGESLDD